MRSEWKGNMKPPAKKKSKKKGKPNPARDQALMALQARFAGGKAAPPFGR